MRHIPLLATFIFFMTGCLHDAFYRLDAASKSDWEVCAESISRAQCGASSTEAAKGSLIAYGMCISPLVDKYAAVDASERKRWLVRHGCPRDMVE